MYDAASGSSPAGGRMYFGAGAVACSESGQRNCNDADPKLRHCERSEAIQTAAAEKFWMLRCARNDSGESLSELRLHHTQPVQLHPHLVAGLQPQRLHQAPGQHELSRVKTL